MGLRQSRIGDALTNVAADLSDGLVLEYVAGVQPVSLELNGSSQFVQVADPPRPAQISICVGFRIDSQDGTPQCVAACTNAASSKIPWRLEINPNYGGNPNTIYFELWNEAMTEYRAVQHQTALSINTNYRLIATYDGAGGIAMVINSVAASSTPTGTLAGAYDSASASPLLTLGELPASSHLFDGKIEGFRIYDRILTAAQIEHYMQGRLPLLDALVAYPMTGVAGAECTSLLDAVGSLDMTPTGSPDYAASFFPQRASKSYWQAATP